jgi:hypothetical protein
MQVSFDTFSKVSNNPNEAVEKEKLKAIIGLYLTIIYLITKSLVRINTSYSIAFGIFERDCLIMQKKADMEEDETSSLLKDVSIDNNPIAITEYFNEKGKLNKRVKNLVYRNIGNHYNDFTFKIFRNNVEHLTVVSKLPSYIDDITNVKSYFDLYHYVMFRLLYDGKNGNSSISSDITKSKYGDVIKYQSACKDFLYGILAPFAYNPARYINLACKNKFIESYGK